MLSLKEVADKLGLSVATIRSYIKSGKLKVTKINKRVYRVTAEELERFLNGK